MVDLEGIRTNGVPRAYRVELGRLDAMTRILAICVSTCAIAGTLLLSTPAAFAATNTHNASTISNSTSSAKLKPWIPPNMSGPISIQHIGDVTVVQGKMSESSLGSMATTGSNIAASPETDYLNIIWQFSNYLYDNWIGPYSIDARGPHYNLHIQSASTAYQDAANYHIRYQGINDGEYTWTTYDSVSGEGASYQVSAAVFNAQGAAEEAAQAMANEVGSTFGQDIGAALMDIENGVGTAAGDLETVFSYLME